METQAADLTVAVQDYLKAIYALESEGERVTTSALATRMGVRAPVGDGDDEAPRRPRSRRARAIPGRRPDGRRGSAARSRCSVTTACSRATSSTASGSPSTRCTRRPSSSSMRSRRSSRRRSTPTSGSRRTTRTATRSPIASFAWRRSPAAGRCSICRRTGGRWSPACPTENPELLRYLAELGLLPGSDVEVVSQAPFGGPVTVRTESGDHAISRELAARIGTA